MIHNSYQYKEVENKISRIRKTISDVKLASVSNASKVAYIRQSEIMIKSLEDQMHDYTKRAEVLMAKGPNALLYVP